MGQKLVQDIYKGVRLLKIFGDEDTFCRLLEKSAKIPVFILLRKI